MKTTQTYAFIKTKKEISMSKEAFSAFVDTKDKDLLAQIASLPEFNIADASINKYVEFLVNAVRKSDQKIKEKIFYLLCYFLNVRKDDHELLSKFIRDFKSLEQTAFFKVKMATILFKSVENKQFKKELLLESIKLLSQEPKLTNLISLLQTIDPILVELNLSQSQLAQIYQLSIKPLEKIPLYKNLTIHLILKFLKLPSNKLDPAVIQRSLLYLIQNATVNEQIVELIQSTDNNTITFLLFKLFLSGDLEGYKKLASQRSADIKNLNINIRDYERKLKINSIANLASTNKILKYSEISERLQIPKDQVQYYVITAIQNNIISARINQIDEIVTVEDIKSKYFNQEEWKNILVGVQTLEAKLAKYAGKEQNSK